MLNKIQIIGNLGADPKIVQLRDGVIVHISVATTEPEYMTARGQMVPERTTWHRVNIYGNMAKQAAQSLYKGSKVYVEGKLVNHQYPNKETGEILNSLEIECNYLEFLSPKPATASTTADAPAEQEPTPQSGADSDGLAPTDAVDYDPQEYEDQQINKSKRKARQN